MRYRLCFLSVFLWMAACQRHEIKVLVGPTALVAPGTPGLTDSVVVIAGSKFRAVGLRKDVPIPQDSERIDLTGDFVVPLEGGRIAPGEIASLEVRQGRPDGPVLRRMTSGEWTQ